MSIFRRPLSAEDLAAFQLKDTTLNNRTLKGMGVGGLVAGGALGAYDWLTPKESYGPLTAGLAAGGITGLGLASKPAQALVSRLTGKVDKEVADTVLKEVKKANKLGKNKDDISDVLSEAVKANKQNQKAARNIDIANKVGLGTTLGAGAIGSAYAAKKANDGLTKNQSKELSKAEKTYRNLYANPLGV